MLNIENIENTSGHFMTLRTASPEWLLPEIKWMLPEIKYKMIKTDVKYKFYFMGKVIYNV